MSERGNVYTYNLDSCKADFEFHIGGIFMDMAHTPNGRLYAISLDSLYQLYENGTKRAIGSIPFGKGLVGLNDSTLIMDSLLYIVAINTNDASTRLIGYTGYLAEGDLTWIDRSLYMVGDNQLSLFNKN